MELRHLRYFIAVAEEQNVTRAAARLHVSQPPLSRQIHDLEEELGVELFERTGKSVRLTDAGRVFLIEAQAALLRVEQAVQCVRAVASGKNGELHLGYAPSPTVGTLPPALRAFQQKFPSVRVILHDMSSMEMLIGLREGKLHAALMVQPSRQALRGIVFEKVRTYPMVIAMSPAHRLSARRSVTLRDINGEPLVVYSQKEYPDYHELIERVAGAKKKLPFAEECDSGMSLIAAVESGKGVAIMAASIADTAGKRLSYVPLTPKPPPAVVGIAYRKDRFTALTRSLVEIVLEMTANSSK
jgi:LysR family transcriptional regulator, benzoate and cis,cis-muconate-responsive activator of ben and cat genes